MANRRNFGSGSYSGGSGGGYNQSNRSNYNIGAGLSGVNPWQSGSSPGRSGIQSSSSSGVPSLLATNNLLNQLTQDSQLALATKLLSSILPVQQSVQQPPSLMSINNSFGSSMRYGSGGNVGGDRYRRDDRRPDNFRNRRQANDRNKDRKGGDNKGRSDKSKSKPVKDEKDKIKKEDEEDDNEGERKEEESKVEKTSKTEDDAPKDKGDKDREEGPIPEYEGIPTKLFHCHVCGKSMWNDVSFDTHVKGRNHRNKLRDLEENYQLQTDLMRQIAAVSLKLDELRRGGKRRPYPDQYCKMCDLSFNGMTMFAHRSTTEHQNLKRFIHPTCDMCKIDFQVRIEYDEHVLTPQHLQQEAKSLLRKEKFEKDPKYIKLRESEAKVTTFAEEANDIGEKGDGALSADDKALIKGILDEKDNLPEYDPDSENPVAQRFVVPQSGYYCKACKVFLLSEDTIDVHCRTLKHFNSYISVLKSEANKKQKESENADSEKRKSGSNEDNSGNWKRRKVDSKNSELNGGNKYDPEETLDDSLEDDTSNKSADVKEEVKMETSEPEPEKIKEEPKPVTTPRRARGRAAKK